MSEEVRRIVLKNIKAATMHAGVDRMKAAINGDVAAWVRFDAAIVALRAAYPEMDAEEAAALQVMKHGLN